MMPIFIVGPTATGKTDLALAIVPFLLELPGVKGVDILSADSKQVYIGQDVVTGKDKDKLTLETEKLKGKLEIFGIDLVNPNQEWSVAHFIKYARSVLTGAEAERHLVIIVGGTGQYLNSLISTPATVTIPKNNALRQELKELGVLELQKRLNQLDPKKLEAMNNSDRNNPRRLVRAIEVAFSSNVPEKSVQDEKDLGLWIGLTAAKETLVERIHARVKNRLHNHAITETKQLLTFYPDWVPEAKAAIGYQEIIEFLDGKLDTVQLEQLWTLHELQYAKRQMGWFRKIRKIQWFNADAPQLVKLVEAAASTWYTEST